ncbi:hypothetical protein [Komagataeibacter europaeus]|nr:hypothetical protein [Komagataeibacter europaeus]
MVVASAMTAGRSCAPMRRHVPDGGPDGEMGWVMVGKFRFR